MEQIFRQWIGMHRAMIAWYHAAHHVTKGAGFGGDHVNIYGEIYTQLDEDLDTIVEKGIGLTGDETLADPVSSLSLAATKLAQYPAAANQDAETIASHAFALSKEYIAFIESIYSQFEACGMSLGLDDLLQGLANQYETYVYLLQQRSRTVSLHKETNMRITKSQLRRTLRKVIRESAFQSPDRGQITSTAGMERFADHRTFFDMIKQAEREDPGAIDMFIDWAYDAAESTLPEWMVKSKQAKWVGMSEAQWELLWDYVEEMGREPFIKEIMS